MESTVTLNAQAHRRRGSGVVLPVAAWALLIAISTVWGQKLIESTGGIGLSAPPLFGAWDVRVGVGLLPAVAIGAVAVALSPRLTRISSWRTLCWTSAAIALAWSAALALSAGPDGLFGPLTTPYEYLAGIPAVGDDPGRFLDTFTERIVDYPVHVQGHPPGLVLVYWALDQLGLGGREPATVLTLLVGVSAVPAALIAARTVAGEDRARAAAPFLALMPAAVWIATSGDAFFMGVGAWSVCATVLALTSSGRRSTVLAILGGAGFGACLLLSYGLVLLGAVPLAVAISQRRARPILIAAAVAAIFVALPLLAGFWWLDGLAATRERYLAGVAQDRPFGYFLVANIAALGLAVGPAVAAALSRVSLSRFWILPAGGLASVAMADLSGMSKAEVERIWLPFVPWIVLATAALAPKRLVMPLLAAQVGLGIAIQAFVRTPW